MLFVVQYQEKLQGSAWTDDIYHSTTFLKPPVISKAEPLSSDAMLIGLGNLPRLTPQMLIFDQNGPKFAASLPRSQTRAYSRGRFG